MKVEIREATPEDAIALCESLREREREAFDRFGEDARKELLQALSRSFIAYTGFVDEKPVALWGAQVSTMLSDEAYVWLICSKEVDAYPITFLRHSRRALRDFSQQFKTLRGLVMADFGCSVTWLEWLGFTVEPEHNGVRPFVMQV